MRISDWSSDVCSSDLVAFTPVRIAVLTVSDSRTLAEDRSGDILVEKIEGAGHILAARYLEQDDKEKIVARLHGWIDDPEIDCRSEEHTSELQSLMRISYAVFCLKKKTYTHVDNEILS